ncbi:MAG: hypothetical protein APR54_02020 [Candidatus Cloacimonas sp. SDB]|nr:MAG: hypothetical protein APR54_02020 [Candidatus Cloacimonas sp. SDB]
MNRIVVITITIMTFFTSLVIGQQIENEQFEITFDSTARFSEGIPEIGRDEVDYLKWVQSNEEGGCIPSDICYVPSENSFFIYGDRRISIIDAETESILNTIDTSVKGHWKYFPRTEEREKRIVYNPLNNRVYCATESMEIIVINPTHGGQIEEIISNSYPDNEYWWMMLEIDGVNNKLYWGITAADYSYLTIIDCETSNIVHEEEIENRIYTLKCHPSRNNVYIANEDGVSLRQTISPYNEIHFFNTGYRIGVIEILYDEAIDLDYTIFCERDRNNNSPEEIYVVNENTGSFSSIDNLEFSFFSSSCYSKEAGKFYLGYQQQEGCGIMIFDNNFQLLDTISFQSNIDDPCDIIYNSLTEKVFCGTRSNMYIIDDESNVSQITFENNVLYRLALSKEYNKVFATNYNVYNVESFSGEGFHQNTISVGGRIFNSCYNSNEGKIYYYERLFGSMDNTKLYVFDIEIESFEILEIGHSISDVQYNQDDHLLYLSSSDSNIIRIFDVLNDYDELPSIQLSHTNVHSICITPNNQIFCMTRDGIEIWDILTNSFENFINYDGSNFDRSESCILADENKIYITLKKFGIYEDGKILVIDYESNQLIYEFNNFYSPDEIKYDSVQNKVFFQQQNVFYLVNHYNVINCDDYSYETIITEEGVLYFELAENLGKLYITPLNYDGYIYEYNSSTNEHLQTHQTTGVASITKFNPFNNKLYVIIPYNFSNDYQTEIWTIDCETSQINRMELGQFESYRYYLPAVPIDITISEENNKLYFGTGHSKLAVIQCEDSETKTFSSGWNWESFPRLDRDEEINESKDVVPILERIEPFNGIDGIDFISENDRLIFDGTFWNPLFFNIQSTWLYKVDIDPYEERTLELFGTRMAENFVIEDTFGAEDYYWLGYWLPVTQNMDYAFGEFWDKVQIVKAEEWTYWRESQQRGNPSDPEPRPSSKIRPLEYGKGYMVKFNEEIEDFHWYNSGILVDGYERPRSENFLYEEKSDYEVIDVMNIDSEVIEIGVFQDDICVGAIAVSDSSEQILVYSDAANRDPVPFNFEIVIGRGLSIPIRDYEVLNHITGEYESNLIISGRQEYSVIRFGEIDKPDDNTPLTPKLYINHPNPFNPSTTISFSVANMNSFVTLEIFNIKGQKVKTLYSGIAEEGKHTFIWEGKDMNGDKVGSGIYFSKLKTDNIELTRKMLMLK